MDLHDDDDMDSCDDDFLAVPVCYMSNWQYDIDLMAQLCQFTNNVICLEGPSGSGKTSFLRYLQAHNPPHLNCQMIDGGMVDSVAALMHEVAECFGLRWQGSTQILQQFSEQLSLVSNHDTWLLLVDDADSLPSQLWLALTDLALAQPEPQKNIHVVLSGKPGFNEQLLDAVQSRRVIKTHALQLKSLSESECQRFYQHIVQHMGADEELVTTQKLQQIFQQSRGLPGAYKQLTTQLLKGQSTMSVMPEEHQQSEDISTQLSGSRALHYFSAQNILLGFAVLGFAAVLLSIVGGGDQAVTGDVSFQLSEDALVLNDQDISPSGALAAERSEFDSKLASAVEALKQEAQLELAATSKTRIAPTSEKPRGTQQVLAAVAKTPQPKPIAKETKNKQPVPAVAASKSLPKAARAAVLPETVAEVQADTIEKMATFSPYESRLLTQPANHYTIQVLAVSSEDNAKTFVASANKATGQSIGYYHRISQGKSWYVVTLGSYNSRPEAQAAIRKLADSVGKYKPFVRTFSPIHAEIESTAKAVQSEIS